MKKKRPTIKRQDHSPRVPLAYRRYEAQKKRLAALPPKEYERAIKANATYQGI